MGKKYCFSFDLIKSIFVGTSAGLVNETVLDEWLDN